MAKPNFIELSREDRIPILYEDRSILAIDKPAGWTSHDVVARARHLLRERRVGHTGTLDPFATGVLVLLTGRATRLAQFLSGLDKEYEAVIRLGYATDTGDVTGKPLIDSEALNAKSTELKFGESEIEAALAILKPPTRVRRSSATCAPIPNRLPKSSASVRT